MSGSEGRPGAGLVAILLLARPISHLGWRSWASSGGSGRLIERQIRSTLAVARAAERLALETPPVKRQVPAGGS